MLESFRNLFQNTIGRITIEDNQAGNYILTYAIAPDVDQDDE